MQETDELTCLRIQTRVSESKGAAESGATFFRRMIAANSQPTGGAGGFPGAPFRKRKPAQVASTPAAAIIASNRTPGDPRVRAPLTASRASNSVPKRESAYAADENEDGPDAGRRKPGKLPVPLPSDYSAAQDKLNFQIAAAFVHRLCKLAIHLTRKSTKLVFTGENEASIDRQAQAGTLLPNPATNLNLNAESFCNAISGPAKGETRIKSTQHKQEERAFGKLGDEVDAHGDDMCTEDRSQAAGDGVPEQEGAGL
eukprot:GHVT01069213.1.p1 GENE.GHVT01069213.1~~GHVT01069213.1.p1  ORF type:complete len:256 (-),score=48.97 GHVT01069213.1:276-1043(-)